MHLHTLPADQLRRDISALREQVAAVSPPKTMLEAHQRDRLMLRLWQLQDELTRRAHDKYSQGKGRRTPRVRYSWRGSRPKRSIAEKLNREADKRMRLALELGPVHERPC